MDHQTKRESPEYVRTSTAAAITMDKLPGRFLRQAQLFCINLLLTYDDGCAADCAYCGLSGNREVGVAWSEKSFIRVDWPTFPLIKVISSMSEENCSHVERVCISMVTNGRALKDTIKVTQSLKKVTDSISVLITPTIVDREWLSGLKKAGADMIGVAVDAATPELFDELRGRGVKGPHRWDKYWSVIEDSIEEFGKYMVGIHLIVGLGETEEEMIKTIQKAESLGVYTHLFSFFPEEDSLMEDRPQPPIGQYRRVQLARYIINNKLSTADAMTFNSEGKVIDYGLSADDLHDTIILGTPFMTSGCPGETKECACNRPFGNSTPSQALRGHLRNFPFKLDQKDITIVREQLKDYSYELLEPRFV